MKKVTNIENWGDTENGTMYDGLNLFEFYVSDEVTKQMETLIRDEYDLDEHDNIQEVYLGFYEPNDKIYFVSGWDILTGNGISSCLLHFRIEDSKMKNLEIPDDSYEIFYDEIFKGFNTSPQTFTHIRLD